MVIHCFDDQWAEVVIRLSMRVRWIAIRKGTRPSVQANTKQAISDWLKMFCVITLLLSLAPVAVKKHNWWEDGRGPNLKTSAWQPYRRYSPDVEEALTILQGTDAAEVLYLRSRGNPIIFIPGVKRRAGDTTPLGVIELPERFRDEPAAIAVILSHEIFHAERHDPIAVPREYPLWRRLLWHSEEEAAHCKGLWTAMKLSFKYPSVWQVLGAQWLLEPPLYVTVGPQSIAANLALLFLAIRTTRRGRLRIAEDVATAPGSPHPL
jgi:hypothetical protein